MADQPASTTPGRLHSSPSGIVNTLRNRSRQTDQDAADLIEGLRAALRSIRDGSMDAEQCQQTAFRALLGIYPRSL
jgi:hypothetical protein